MLLVSCCGEKGGLFTLDEDTLEIKQVSEIDYTGITFSPDGRLYGFSHSLKSICMYDLGFNTLGSIQVENDFHGLLYSDGGFYAVDTYSDKVWRYEPTTLVGSIVFDFSDSNILGIKGKGLYHINDVAVKDGFIFFSMFGDTIPTEEERSTKGRPPKSGRVYVKDLQDTDKGFGKLFIDKVTQPHTPIIMEDNTVYLCNSRESSIVKGRLNYVNKEPIFSSREEIVIDHGFTRGLYVKDNRLFIGISNSVVRTGTGKFDNVVCGVLILDLLTKEQQFVPLPANEVYGIIPINNLR